MTFIMIGEIKGTGNRSNSDRNVGNCTNLNTNYTKNNNEGKNWSSEISQVFNVGHL